MAEISVERDKGGNFTWLWAALAVLSVLGLMFWLASQDVEAPVAIEEEGAEQVAAGEAAELPAIAAAPETFAGRPLAVQGVPVAATLGPRGFWGDVPGANPFLVVLAPEVANPEVAAVGQAVNVQGTVAPVTPELVEQWIQQGQITEGARDEAGFATYYLLATQVEPGQAAAAPAAAPAGQ